MHQPNDAMQHTQNKLSPHLAERLAWAAVLAVALFLRLYKISTYPIGLHVDEAGAAYDAFCLATGGVDRYLLHNPVYFINFGGGQNALYTYCMVLLFKVFGVSTLMIRLPMVVFGMVTVVCGGLLARTALGPKGGLVCGTLLACCPIFVAASRFGLESYLLMGMSTASVYVFTLAVAKQRKRWYVLAGVLLGITLYTYAVAYLILPLFLLLSLVYLVRCHRVTAGQVVSLAVPLAVLAAPLIAMLVINRFGLPQIETALFTIPKLAEYRGGEIRFANIPQNLLAIWKMMFWRDRFAYNTLQYMNTLFIFTIPFSVAGMVLGCVQAGKEMAARHYSAGTCVVLFFVAAFCTSLLLQDLNANRVNALYFPLAYFAALGFRAVWRRVRGVAPRRVAAAAFAAVYLAGGMAYLYDSFTCLHGMPFTQFNATFDAPLQALAESGFDGPVYIDDYYIYKPQIYYLLASKTPPQQMPQNEGMQFSAIGNVHFGVGGEADAQAAYLVRDDCEEPLKTQLSTLAAAGGYTTFRHVDMTLYIPVGS